MSPLHSQGKVQTRNYNSKGFSWLICHFCHTLFSSYSIALDPQSIQNFLGFQGCYVLAHLLPFVHAFLPYRAFSFPLLHLYLADLYFNSQLRYIRPNQKWECYLNLFLLPPPFHLIAKSWKYWLSIFSLSYLNFFSYQLKQNWKVSILVSLS